MQIPELKLVCKDLRKEIIKMLHAAGSGHPGGSLSSVEIAASLYFNHMNFNPSNPQDPLRDYFILSKGHAAPVLYAVLAKLECIKNEELCTLRKLGSRLQGHPASDKGVSGIEISTGSLGYGLGVGAGIAKGIKTRGGKNRVYVLMGDGEQQEGSIWEAAMAAAHFKLDNLCAIVDYNNLQIDGKVSDVMGIEPIADKYKAFGFNVLSIDGHNLEEIDAALKTYKLTTDKPTAIIAKTVKGKGVSFMEHNADWHGKVPNAEIADKAIAEIDACAQK